MTQETEGMQNNYISTTTGMVSVVIMCVIVVIPFAFIGVFVYWLVIQLKEMEGKTYE